MVWPTEAAFVIFVLDKNKNPTTRIFWKMFKISCLLLFLRDLTETSEFHDLQKLWKFSIQSIKSLIFVTHASLSVLTGKVGTVTMVTGLRTVACPTSWVCGASTAVGFPSDWFPWLITVLFTWAPLVLACVLAWTCGRVWWVKVWVMWPTMVGWETVTPWE